MSRSARHLRHDRISESVSVRRADNGCPGLAPIHQDPGLVPGDVEEPAGPRLVAVVHLDVLEAVLDEVEHRSARCFLRLPLGPAEAMVCVTHDSNFERSPSRPSAPPLTDANRTGEADENGNGSSNAGMLRRAACERRS